MQTSESINELAAALAKAQGKIVGAVKDSANPIGIVRRGTDIGYRSHDYYQWLACEGCSKERWVVLVNNRTTPKSTLCVSCGTARFNETRRGNQSPVWRGGRRASNGYVMVYLQDDHRFASMRVGGRYIAEHRLVMAEHIGRPLTRDEIVHHKDGNRSNNQITNLELTALGRHSKDHSQGYEHGFKQGYADGVAASMRRAQ